MCFMLSENSVFTRRLSHYKSMETLDPRCLAQEALLRYRMAGITESAMVAYTHKYAVV